MVVDIRRFDLRRNPNFQSYKQDSSEGIARAVRTAAIGSGTIGAAVYEKKKREEEEKKQELRKRDEMANAAFVNQQNREFDIKDRAAKFEAAKDVYKMESELESLLSKLKTQYDGREPPDITKQIDEKHRELSQNYTKDKGFLYKSAFSELSEKSTLRVLNQALREQTELSFMKQANDLQSALSSLTVRAKENPSDFETAADEFYDMANNSALPVKTKYKLIIEAKREIARSAVEGRIAQNPAGVSRELLNGVYKDYLTVEDAKELAKQADEDDFYLSLQISSQMLLDRLNAVDGKGRYTDFLSFDEKDRAAFRKAVKDFEKKEKRLADKGYGAAQSKNLSVAQMANKRIFENLKKENNGRIFKSLPGVFEYRNSVSETYENGGLDDRDYASLMADSAVPLLKLAKKDYSGGWFPRRTAFEEAVAAVNEKTGLEAETDAVKASVYDEIYRGLKESGIGMDAIRFDREPLKNIVSRVVEDYAVNKNAGLLGVKAQMFLTGARKITPEEGNKTDKADYKLFDAPDGRYRVFPDKNGNFTDDSLKIRVAKWSK